MNVVGELSEQGRRAMLAGYLVLLSAAEEALSDIENECKSLEDAQRIAHDALDRLGVPA